jgi:hypothetical protein
MKVLVACEYSGVVRRAFRAKGHEAWSCDIIDSEDDNPFHYKTDVREVLQGIEWDLVIAHPPCTYLTVAANKWLYHPEDKHLDYADRRPHPDYPTRRQDMLDAVEFAKMFYHCADKVAIENPKGRLSTLWRKPDQIIQPWQFGHGEVKGTHLWLKNLPLLTPTNVVAGREAKVWKMGPSEDRWKERSRTYEGIAAAMAAQWG